MPKISELLIGTSGFDYPEWKGSFYPETLPRKDFLSYYATQFNALEINNTFYSMPTKERLAGFYQRAEGRLQFSIKANRLLTHEISCTWKNAADEFIQAVETLQEKGALASILFQFPQSFHYTNENRYYLSDIIKAFTDFPVVIEFRHIEWIKPSVIEGLQQRNASLAFCDMPQLKNLPDGITRQTPFVGDIAYVRLHGRNEKAWYTSSRLNENDIAGSSNKNGSARYDYNYSDEELMQFVPVIETATKSHKKIQVFFNNHPNGSGPTNGIRLKELLSQN